MQYALKYTEVDHFDIVRESICFLSSILHSNCCKCEFVLLGLFFCLYFPLDVIVFFPTPSCGKQCCSVLLIKQPMEVYVDDETKLTLHGLQQYYVKLKDQEKNRKLFDLLDVLEFNQVSRCSYSHLRSCCSERRTRIQIGYKSVMREYQFWKDIIKKIITRNQVSIGFQDQHYTMKLSNTQSRSNFVTQNWFPQKCVVNIFQEQGFRFALSVEFR